MLDELLKRKSGLGGLDKMGPKAKEILSISISMGPKNLPPVKGMDHEEEEEESDNPLDSIFKGSRIMSISKKGESKETPEEEDEEEEDKEKDPMGLRKLFRK